MTDNTAAHAFAGRLSLFYGALFVVYGMHVPFMPVWLDWRGLSAAEISIVMAAPLILRAFVTPAVAAGADRRGDHRRTVLIFTYISLVLVLTLSAVPPFWPICAALTGLIVSNATVMPLTETIAVNGARAGRMDYGRVRLWGSLTFVAASFAGGAVIEIFGGGAGIWLVAGGCALTVAVAHVLPADDADQHVASRAPLVAMPRVWKKSSLVHLLHNPAFLVFLIAAGIAQASHATFLTFGTLIWQRQGLNAGWGGGLWAIGVFAEVLLFARASAILRRIGPSEILLIGSGAAVLRWLVMASDPPLALLIPLQLLHGLTYGATHIGAMHFIQEAVPRHAAGSAQALYATVAAGVAMGIATLMSGWIYAQAGSGFAYGIMALLAAVALMAAIRLHKIWPRRATLTLER